MQDMAIEQRLDQACARHRAEHWSGNQFRDAATGTGSTPKG